MSLNPLPKLGRLPSVRDPRTIRLARYVTPGIAPPPAVRTWHAAVPDWGMMGNDENGNCVIVTAAHARLLWRANELGDTKRITDSAVIALSTEMGALDGYNILDRLKYWRREGMWANYLWAFAAIDPANTVMLKSVINTFGVADIGLNMPAAWQGAAVWRTGTGRDYRPGTWGGHSVPLVGYDADYFYAATWGTVIPVTAEALVTYCDEAYALINPDWIAKDARTPAGFDLASLHHDLFNLTGRRVA